MVNRIKELREQQGLSQTQLADRLGAHYLTISKLERGEMQLNTKWMDRIAGALSVSARDLIAEGSAVDLRLADIETKLDKAAASINRLMAHLGVKED